MGGPDSGTASDKFPQTVAADISRDTLSRQKSAPTNVGGYFVTGPADNADLWNCGFTGCSNRRVTRSAAALLAIGHLRFAICDLRFAMKLFEGGPDPPPPFWLLAICDWLCRGAGSAATGAIAGGADTWP